MIENIIFNKTLPRIVAINNAIDMLQVFITVNFKFFTGIFLLQFFGFLFYIHHAVCRIGVCREPVGQAVSAGFSFACCIKHVKKVGHLCGVVPHFGTVLNTKVIRLPLVIARIFKKKQTNTLFS